MARTKKKESYETPAENIEASIQLEVINAPKGDIQLSVLGFSTEFSNWKNYIHENDLEKTKKEFYPKIGSTITHYSGDVYKIIDIRLDYIQYHPKLNDANPNTVYNHPVYTVIIEKQN